MPEPDPTLDARVADLETRLADLAALVAELASRLERAEQSGAAAPGTTDETLIETVLLRLLPADAVRHMKSARREDLLAIRSVLDAWLTRLERTGDAADGPRRRESISLE